MITDELTVNVSQAVFLSQGPRRKTVLKRLEKKVCCKFDIKQLQWDAFKVEMKGTVAGIKNGRALLIQELENRFGMERRHRQKSTKTFPQFNMLPTEVRQMIIDRVPCNEVQKQRYDGRVLMDLRLINKEFMMLAERTLQRERKCFKERIFIAETWKSGQIRLGTPPFQSRIFVSIEEFSQLLDKTMLTGSKEVHIRCEFRREWCDAMLGLLMENKHIEPTTLKIYGLTGRAKLLHEYVAETPSLKQLIFEKPLYDSSFFKTKFMSYEWKHFFNLGPQDSLPENIRNAFNNRFVFSRQPIDEDAHEIDKEYLNF